jgi:hypothetical protein
VEQYPSWEANRHLFSPEIQKFYPIHRTWMLNTVFMSPPLVLDLTSPQPLLPPPCFFKNHYRILPPCIGLLICLFPSYLPTNISSACIFRPMCATCSTHLSFSILRSKLYYKAIYYAVLSVLLLLLPSKVKILSSALSSWTSHSVLSVIFNAVKIYVWFVKWKLTINCRCQCTGLGLCRVSTYCIHLK